MFKIFAKLKVAQSWTEPVDQTDARLPNQMQDAHAFFMWNNHIKSSMSLVDNCNYNNVL